MPPPHATRTTLCIALLFSLFSPLATAQTMQVDAVALVRSAIQRRIAATKNHHPLQYIVHRTDERRDTTKVIIETSDGDVARLIAINGKPLSDDAAKAETDRLDTLAAHPELQERRRKNEQRDSDRITHLLSELPDALLFKLEGSVACGSHQCYRFSFTPNPNWSPPDLESGILRGFAGQLWIDESQERLVRLEGHFIDDVDLGFGLIGRLNKGGTALLEQADIGSNDWELTGLNINVSGKAFIFKSFVYHVDEQTTHFTPVAPGLHYRDAITLLKQLDPASYLTESAEARH